MCQTITTPTAERTRHHGRRRHLVAAVGIIGALALAIVPPTPALAHGGGTDTSNYISVITGGTAADAPDDDVIGLEWQIIDGDARVELSNRTDLTVTVLGYDGEPYLRFSPDGTVEENRRSPATTRNRTRFDDLPIPADADPTAAPEWSVVDDDHRYAWYDHRIHWIAPTLPSIVTDETVETLVFSWSIPYEIDRIDGTQDDAAAEAGVVTGELRWIPDRSWRVPMFVTLGLFTVIATVALATTLPVHGAWPGLARSVTAIVAAVMAANAIRLIDDIAAADATLAQDVFLGVVTMLALATIGLLIARGRSGKGLWFMAVAAAGVLTMVMFGGESFGQITAPNLVTTLPSWVRRWTVAASFATVLPTTIAALAGAMAHARHLRSTHDPASGPRGD